MTDYNQLLVEANVQSFFKSTQPFRNEHPDLTSENARDRIKKDYFDMWSQRTIIDALPDEAKDLKKQKAGRLIVEKVNP